ncbi:hypothetical protein EWM64_g10960, partial [Hericium alpestre]
NLDLEPFYIGLVCIELEIQDSKLEFFPSILILSMIHWSKPVQNLKSKA